MARTFLTGFCEQFPNFVAKFTMEELQRLYATCKANYHASEIGVKFYFAVGSALAAIGEWNSMSFKQLEYEARVQGFLGPHEENLFSEWTLRLKLALEAKSIEEEKRRELQFEVGLPDTASEGRC